MSVGIGQCNMPGAYAYPSYKNICGDEKVNERVKIGNFCAFPGQGTLRSNYAKSMSSDGEWRVDDTYFPPCNFRPGSQPASMDGPQQCCGGQCKIRGDQLFCIRTKYTGNPLNCCLQNSDRKPGLRDDIQSERYKACFSDANQQNTCAPQYRNIDSKECSDLLGEYCAGIENADSKNSTQWLDRWFKPQPANGITKGLSCYDVIFDRVFENPKSAKEALKFTGECDKKIPPELTINAEGYFWAQETIRKTLEHYNEQFKIGSLPGSVKSNPWEILFYQKLCCPLPGVCQDGLNKICETSTINDMKLNSLLAQWCGCHMANDQYEEYSRNFNIPKQCSSTCNRYGAIPLVGIGNEAVSCDQNICLIDDINISIVNTQVGGGINFNQFCNNCAGKACTCVVSGTSVTISDSSIGGNVIPGLQTCGEFNCRQKNPSTSGVGPAYITVPCDETNYNPYDDYNVVLNQEKNKARKKSWTLTIIITLISLIIIYLIIIFVHPKK